MRSKVFSEVNSSNISFAAKRVHAELHGAELMRRAQYRNATTSVPRTEVIKTGSLVVIPEMKICFWQSCKVNLTRTQVLVVECLAKRPGIVRTQGEILEAAFGIEVENYNGQAPVIIKRIRSAFRKVDRDFAEIQSDWGVGYRWQPSRDHILALINLES